MASGVKELKQGDTEPFEVGLSDSDGVIVLTDAEVEFRMKNVTGGTPIIHECEIVNAEKGIVRVTLEPGDTLPGLYKVEFTITFLSGTVKTVPGEAWEDLRVWANLAS